MNFVNSENPQDERRQYERARLIIDVFFDGNDLTGVASTQDISPGGLYMNTQAEIPEGALLLLRVPLAGRDLICNGEVVYSNPGRGVGVNFQGLSEEDRAFLEQAIASR
ncbi:MAG TPA: PilZ domain-containing protein [Pyrinomonadaceae bacterium]|nr:PilZ domain-containing protein [Pyrinomonadaceae bacterium]